MKYKHDGSLIQEIFYKNDQVTESAKFYYPSDHFKREYTIKSFERHGMSKEYYVDKALRKREVL